MDWLNVYLKRGHLFGALASNYKHDTVRAARVSSQNSNLPWWQLNQKKKVKVRVDMPSGVAAIRGTFWENTVFANGHSSTDLLTGAAEVTGNGKTVSLVAGQKAEVKGADAQPTAPFALTEQDKQEWLNEQEWVKERADSIQGNLETALSGQVTDNAAIVRDAINNLENRPHTGPGGGSGGGDSIAPSVAGSSPVHNTIGAPVAASVVVNFSEQIRAASQYSAIALRDQVMNPVPATIVIDTNKIIITAVYNLNYNSTYSVYIPAGAIEDFAGNLLAANYNLTFTTGTRPVSLSTPVNYPVGVSPYHGITDDFNGDIIADFAVANFTSNNISILLGNGDGTYQPALTTAAGAGPHSAASWDFNGDFMRDLAIANSGANNVSILIGNGDGTFTAGPVYTVENAPYSVAIDDFNLDAVADLAVANVSSHSISILIGLGGGSFQPAVSYPAGFSPYMVISRDLNGDGRPDLAVANNGGGLNAASVLLGNGDGTFQAPVNYAVGSSPLSLNAADLNADGAIDIITGNYGDNTISILIGNGDGTMQSAVSYLTGVGPYNIAVGNFNYDSSLDLAVANYGSHDVSVLLGNGGATFKPAVNFSTGNNPVSLIVGNFNGDSKPDLAAVNFGADSISVLLNNG